jgi:hypothetical protein
MKRFSLKAMLVAATLLAIFVGYSQQRRRNILRECEWLKAEQVQFQLPDTWVDTLWQRTPTDIVVTGDNNGGWNTAENRARIRLEKLGWKFRRMGRMTEVLN